MEASNGLIKEVLSGFSCEEFLSVSISDLFCFKNRVVVRGRTNGTKDYEFSGFSG